MLRLIVLAGLLCDHSDGWWFKGNTTEAPPPETSWEKFWERWLEVTAATGQWKDWGGRAFADAQSWAERVEVPKVEIGFNLWLVIDTLVGFLGWAIFGNAWHGVRSGCRRLLQIGALFLACLIAHYIWAVCYPVVSIIVACVVAVVWVCRRVLRLVGTLIFHMHRFAGGAPEAADVEFHGPGTGVVPETSILRGFKRTGDSSKQVVVRRGDEVAVFNVGSDVQNIRTHRLFLPVEADTARGSPGLVRRISAVDKVHLCRNVVCGEEVGEHFTENGVDDASIRRSSRSLTHTKVRWRLLEAFGVGSCRKGSRRLPMSSPASESMHLNRKRRNISATPVECHGRRPMVYSS